MVKEVYNSMVHKSKGFKICDSCKSVIKDGEDYALAGEYNNEIKLCGRCFKVSSFNSFKILEFKMVKEIRKQSWKKVEEQIRKYYKDYSEDDINICKAFFKSGWNVFPEAGFTFQKVTKYEDGSKNEANISLDEARWILRFYGEGEKE